MHLRVMHPPSRGRLHLYKEEVHRWRRSCRGGLAQSRGTLDMHKNGCIGLSEQGDGLGQCNPLHGESRRTRPAKGWSNKRRRQGEACRLRIGANDTADKQKRHHRHHQQNESPHLLVEHLLMRSEGMCAILGMSQSEMRTKKLAWKGVTHHS